MSLDIVLPGFLLFVAIIDIPIFMFMRARGMMRDNVVNLMMLASVSLPLLAYVILKFVLPDVGAIEVF